jgi:hypothetical protein
VFLNKVLRRIFGRKREDVTGEWRRLHNEVHNLYSSPDTVMMKKSRVMRCVRHIRKIHKIGLEYVKEKRKI